jgi:hypothetical protein
MNGKNDLKKNIYIYFFSQIKIRKFSVKAGEDPK